ncbi:MAG: MFS family permease [Halieaceae bacterium]|jgi:MFS family permease
MFFGWYVVAGTFVSQMFVVGFFSYSASLLVPSVREEFGVTMEQVMYSLTAGTFGGMILMPVAGVMFDRYPARWIMSIGTVLLAGGLWTMAGTSSVTQFILAFGVTMAVANSFTGSLASQTTISRWFTVTRGRALGISAVGTSVGGIAIPALLTSWIETSGWRGSLENLALCILLILLPLLVLTIRGRPSDIGLQAEGCAPDIGLSADIPELKMRDIVRQPGYWYIGLTLGLLFSVYASILANITPYATGLGASAAQASTLIMVVAVMGLVGKLAFGMAADKFNLKVGLWLAMALVFIAFLLMASEPGYPLMLAATALLGLAAGGMLPVWGAMMARVFGLISYGRAMGLMGPLITLLVMPGFAVAGRLYDATGGYQTCLYIFAAVIAVAALLLIPLKLETSMTTVATTGVRPTP